MGRGSLVDLGPGFVWYGTVWPHVAGVSQQFLDNEDIDASDWLIRPPDLIPFTYIWDIAASTAATLHVSGLMS